MKRALIICLIALASATENSSAQGGGKGGAGATKPTEVTGLVVTDRGALGPTIQWSAIEKATYQVQRSKASDTGCCNNASPAGLTTTSWDDSPLPSSGVYVYRVTATLRSGQVVGATQFSYTAPAAPAVSGRYRLMVRSIEVVTPTTNDDPTQADGVGDEVYVAAIVVRADRATGAKLGATAVKSKEYGDIGNNGSTYPNRIKAGTASPDGGLNGGSTIGVPGTPGAETFPFVLWEGSLTDGGEAVVVFPSIWERDTNDASWRDYSGNWMSASAPILGSPLLQNQYSSTMLTPVVATPETGAVQQGVTGPVYGNYVIGLDWLSSVDRMIGMTGGSGNPIYSERILVLTREKLAGMVVGGTTDVQVQLNETMPSSAIYKMILRVERIG